MAVRGGDQRGGHRRRVTRVGGGMGVGRRVGGEPRRGLLELAGARPRPGHCARQEEVGEPERFEVGQHVDDHVIDPHAALPGREPRRDGDLGVQGAAASVQHGESGGFAGGQVEFVPHHRAPGEGEGVEDGDGVLRRRVDLLDVARPPAAEERERPAADVVAELAHVLEAREHLAVDRVDGAAADGVVRVVQEQEPPRLAQQGVLVATARPPRQRGERFGVLLERGLTRLVLALQVEAGREDAGQDVLVAAAAELALEPLQPGGGAAGLRHELLHIALHELDLGERLGGPPEHLGQVRLREQVIGAVEEDEGAAGRVRCQAAVHALERGPEPFGQVGDLVALHTVESGTEVAHGAVIVVRVRQLPVNVTERRGARVRADEVGGEDLRLAVCRDPDELATEPLALVAEAALEDDGRKAEAVCEEGELGDVPERVRRVADGQRVAEAPAHPAPDQQVAYQRLRAHEELVRQHVPGSDAQAPGLDVAAEVALALGPQGEVVLEHRRLTVEREAAVGGVVEEVEGGVDDVHEPRLEDLERLVPLAVPVRVGDHEGGEAALRRGHGRQLESLCTR